MLNIENRNTFKDLEEIELRTGDEYELINGQLIELSRASINHGILAKTISKIFDDQLKNSPCISLVETVEVRIETKDKEESYRPDVTVICPPYDGDQSIVKNPKIVVEILSKSSILIDHNEKREGYLKINDLTCYLVVNQWKKEITVYAPIENGHICKVYRENETFKIKDWFKINVNEIYEETVSNKE